MAAISVFSPFSIVRFVLMLLFLSRINALRYQKLEGETTVPLNVSNFFNFHPNATSHQHGKSHGLPLYSTSTSTAAAWPSFLINALKSQANVNLSASKAAASTAGVSFRYSETLMVEVMVGTPPQKQRMVLDTGSELSWLHCAHKDSNPPPFDPTLSPSYNAVPCSSPVCTKKTTDFPIPASCDSGRFAVGILGNLASLLLYGAPMITFRRVIKNRSTEEFSGFPYAIALLNSLLYTWYGSPLISNGLDDILVLTVNGVGIVLEFVFVCIYLKYAPKKAKVGLNVAAAPTLLIIALLFNEVAIHVVAAAPPGPHANQHVPIPPNPQKSSKVHSSVEASAAGGRKSLKADSPPCSHHNGHVPTPPCSVEASTAGGRKSLKADSAPGTQPNPNVPTPPQQHTVHSSVGASSAGAYPTSTCPPSNQCNSHVPTPGCCSAQSKKENQARVNAGKA